MFKDANDFERFNDLLEKYPDKWSKTDDDFWVAKQGCPFELVVMLQEMNENQKWINDNMDIILDCLNEE